MKHIPRKRFGQHFLRDASVIERIIATIGPSADDLFLEIGPGEGVLTRPLLESGAEVCAVEIDRDLAAELSRNLSDAHRFRLHNEDALRVNFHELSEARPFRLVGNLPYNISTPLMFHVLEWSGLITDMHFMLQKEVVDRMAAGPGSGTYGRLSVMCQYRCRIEPLFVVRPGSFHPPPAVDSRIVRLVPHAKPKVDPGKRAWLERIVRQAFSMRRKTLRNSLRGLLSADQIAAAGIDPALRPERLGLAEFAALARAFGETAES